MASIEERRNLRSAISMVVLSILIILFLFYVGIPVVGRFANFLTSMKSSGSSASDKTPPAPPRFNNLAEYTNQKSFTISGNSEAGATVKLSFNGKETENLADKDGNFTFSIDLPKDENIFSATAVDSSGNISQETKTYKIFYDDKAPELQITKPTDGSNIFGSSQRQVTVEGTTEVDIQLTINDRLVNVEDNGSFQYTTTLSDGENKFKIKANDKANNLTEKEITLNYSP